MQQLWNQAVVKPDESQRSACDGINECLIARGFRRYAAFNPQAQPVEAPSCRPSYERTKKKPVNRFSQWAETCVVVVPCEEADFLAGRNVFPVARTSLHQRLRISGPES